jgi:Sulfotransferase family
LSVSDGQTRPMMPFLFIVGRGRSGTTMLRAMFDTHSLVAIPPESHFILHLSRRRPRYEREGDFDIGAFVADLAKTGFRKWGLSAANVTSALREATPTSYADAVRTVFSTYAVLNGKQRYGDKTPVNVRSISQLANLFPEAIFVHLIRDGRDVTSSYLSVPWGPTSVEESAVYWRLAVEAGRRQGSHISADRYRELRYEELVAAPEVVLRDLCAFAHLAFDPAMLTYHQRVQEVTHGSRYPGAHASVGLPPTRRLRDWRDDLDPSQVALFEALAGRTLERVGYERTVRPIPLAIRVRSVWRLIAISWDRAKGRVGKVFGRLRFKRSFDTTP